MENYSENSFYVMLGACVFFFSSVAVAWVIAAIQHRLEMRRRRLARQWRGPT